MELIYKVINLPQNTPQDAQGLTVFKSRQLLLFYCSILLSSKFNMFSKSLRSFALVLVSLPFISAAPTNESAIALASNAAAVSGYRNAAYFPNW
jgi:hypothetical protein